MISKFIHGQSVKRWSKTAEEAAGLSIEDLRKEALDARTLRQRLDDVIFTAEKRLCMHEQSDLAVFKPKDADWAWRPQLWHGPLHEVGVVALESQTALGASAKVFHDCQRSELTLRQVRNLNPDDLAPFGIRMDVFAFDGSFLTVALDLPTEAVDGLRRKHLIRMNAIVETEKPLEIFARLNLRHGPNTEQLVRELPLAQEDVWVEFDLAYTKLNEKRVERMWVDLIFERPEMNQVTLRDVTFSRSARADI